MTSVVNMRAMVMFSVLLVLMRCLCVVLVLLVVFMRLMVLVHNASLFHSFPYTPGGDKNVQNNCNGTCAMRKMQTSG
ncbi:hypothetical protein ARMA_0390 [Ardenticatena maritima]|uniref:Uncharacterized protein n=1 Tax=Ardenticatena maritima TaxID=872965 RepID=A0A0M9UBN5_9CHLR|nr:hypothetical protein ARMA_0390 [Ardenticatena maritima]